VVHELATNSLKYGALSVSTGTLDVSGALADDEVQIVWSEQGGPEVVAPTGQTGYGSKLLQRTMASTLGGSIAIDWPKSGVLATLRINGEKISR